MRECMDARAALDPAVRGRIHIALLPMEDLEENGAIVNALQRRSDVVVQKSLAEGFGLTVAEAMWKARPVVAARVGGIQDQIEDGVSGVLVDPRNLESFGCATRALLSDRAAAERMGERAHEKARDEYLQAIHMLRFADVIAAATGEPPVSGRASETRPPGFVAETHG